MSGGNEGTFEPTSEPPGAEPVFEQGFSINDAPADLNDLDDVTNTYIRPLNNSCLLYSWASPSGIEADDLIEICAKNNFLSLPRDIEGVYLPDVANVSAEEIEEALQKHFDVDKKYLETSKWYNADTKTYDLVVGGGGAHFRAMSAEQKENLVFIKAGLAVSDNGEKEDKKNMMPYEPYIQGWIIFPSGTLTLELTSDNIVRYISYELNNTFKWE